MRGKRHQINVVAADPGSIPACAGETLWRRMSCAMGGVYPRLCGGNIEIIVDDVPFWGLSPLVRGKRCLSLCLPVPGGSIPACAGETLDLLLIFCLCWVYPRLCGGNCCSVALPLCWPGLSPLVRGKRQHHDTNIYTRGSIPACAGETLSHSKSGNLTRVYPRLCGGNSCIQHYDLLKKNGFSILIC